MKADCPVVELARWMPGCGWIRAKAGAGCTDTPRRGPRTVRVNRNAVQYPPSVPITDEITDIPIDI